VGRAVVSEWEKPPRRRDRDIGSAKFLQGVTQTPGRSLVAFAGCCLRQSQFGRDLGLGEPVHGNTDHQIRILADEADEIAVEQCRASVGRRLTVSRDFVRISITTKVLMPVLAREAT
jgi:hypothetical protein